jgi:hypothetical protein
MTFKGRHLRDEGGNLKVTWNPLKSSSTKKYGAFSTFFQKCLHIAIHQKFSVDFSTAINPVSLPTAMMFQSFIQMSFHKSTRRLTIDQCLKIKNQ